LLASRAFGLPPPARSDQFVSAVPSTEVPPRPTGAEGLDKHKCFDPP
jgi:hypothetical protein